MKRSSKLDAGTSESGKYNYYQEFITQVNYYALLDGIWAVIIAVCKRCINCPKQSKGACSLILG